MSKHSQENHLDTPTPRCFPEWMRRLNPYLKKEDTNPFFEIQTRIRKLYHKLGFYFKTPYALSAFFSMLFVVALFIESLYMTVASLILCLCTFAVIAIKIRTRTINNTYSFREPHFLAQASKQVLSDLWICGVGGKEIIEGSRLLRKPDRSEILFLFAAPFVFQCYLTYWIIPELYSYHTLLCIMCFPAGLYTSYQSMHYKFIERSIISKNHFLELLLLFDISYEVQEQEKTSPEISPQVILKRISHLAILGVITTIIFSLGVILFITLLDNPQPRDLGLIAYISSSIMIIYLWYKRSKTRKKKWFSSMRKTIKRLAVLDRLYSVHFQNICFNEQEQKEAPAYILQPDLFE